MRQALKFCDLIKRAFADEPVAGMILRSETPLRLGVLVIGFLLASGLSGFLFAIIKPANASNLFFFQSWTFWSLHSAAGFGFVIAAELVLLQSSWRRWVRLCLTLGLLPFFLAPFSLYLDNAFHAVDTDSSSAGNALQTYLSEVLDVAPLSIVLTGLAIWLIRALIPREGTRDTNNPSTSSSNHLFQILEGFPAKLGDEVIRLEAQDHYTAVVTPLGQHLLGKSLSECMSALDQFDGIQTHRSHWVNLRHVKSLHPVGSAFECELSNSERVPVSRRRYSLLRHLLHAEIDKRVLDKN